MSTTSFRALADILAYSDLFGLGEGLRVCTSNKPLENAVGAEWQGLEKTISIPFPSNTHEMMLLPLFLSNSGDRFVLRK